MVLLHQPDVALTDFFLALETTILALLIVHIRNKSRIKFFVFFFFLSLALGSILGGIVHGFFPKIGSLENLILWKATMISIGMVALFSWLIAGNIILPKHNMKFLFFASLEFFFYTFFVIFYDSKFEVAIINYAPPTLFLLVCLMIAYFKKKENPILLGIYGILLTFGAALIQQLQISLHQIYFNYNAFYHFVQGIALIMIFFALRKIILNRKFKK